MAKEDLTSDRINYLIWRYLQESNYQQTALALQQDWCVENPRLLQCAPHVPKHTLVKLLHKGLLYHEVERKYTQSHLDAGSLLPGFFGPATSSPPPPPPAGIDEDEFENARKRQLDPNTSQAQYGSPAKRSRLSNGYETGLDGAVMDLDEPANGNGHAYPSPKEVDRPPTPIITHGPEQGTQVDKVTELSSETVFLTLSDKANADKAILLHCEWSPRDPTILAAAGTDALARLWTISRGLATAESNGHVNDTISPPFHDLVDENDYAAYSSVSSIAWTSDGAAIAVASNTAEADDDVARIIIWNNEGNQLQTYSGYDPPILCLRWNPSNTLLLGLVPQSDSPSITIISPAVQASTTYPIPQLMPTDVDFDVVWTGEFEFILCGGDILWAFKCEEGKISLVRKYDTRQNHRLTKAVFDKHSRLLATASEVGVIDIWDEFNNSHSMSAHHGIITSLVWQPLSNQAQYDDATERLLVSSGDDGIISIWNAREDGKPKSSMTMDSAVLALAITPDGAFLAGATNSQILIWRLEDVSIPRARWAPDQGPSWPSPRSNSSAVEEDHHCLAWDADGQKLAFGVKNKLAVIKFRPFG